MALGKNIRKRRLQLGLTQSELAGMVGISQVAIANLERRDSQSSRNLIALADALQCSVRELESGSMVEEEAVEYQIYTRRAPLLNAKQAINWQLELQSLKKHQLIPSLGSSKRVFCLPVEDDSMTAVVGNGPSFPKGYVVHVDPELQASPEDFVVAATEVDGQWHVVFKQLKETNGSTLLRSIHPDFADTITEFTLIGVVVGASLSL